MKVPDFVVKVSVSRKYLSLSISKQKYLSESKKTGLAFKYKIGFIDAIKVNDGQITSSPSFTPSAFKPK